MKDLKEDFLKSTKNAIVDFVLRDRSLDLPDEILTPARIEAKAIKGLYLDDFNNARQKLLRTLNLINPLVLCCLDLWHTKFM